MISRRVWLSSWPSVTAAHDEAQQRCSIVDASSCLRSKDFSVVAPETPFHRCDRTRKHCFFRRVRTRTRCSIEVFVTEHLVLRLRVRTRRRLFTVSLALRTLVIVFTTRAIVCHSRRFVRLPCRRTL